MEQSRQANKKPEQANNGFTPVRCSYMNPRFMAQSDSVSKTIAFPATRPVGHTACADKVFGI